MKLIVGLGNIGDEYKNTRHNIGFIMIDEYLLEKNIKDLREKFKSIYASIVYNGEKIYLQKPYTYMNLSGEAIYEIAKFFKIDVKKDLYVIYDDMDMEFSSIKLKYGGSSGGHNGIKSIISHCGNDFMRIKFGIGKNSETIKHVLGKFTKEEKELIEKTKKTFINIIDDIIKGVSNERLINKYNKKATKKEKIIYRKAELKDIEKLDKIAISARKFQEYNKLKQWVNGYPSIEVFSDDIKKGIGYVIELGGRVISYLSLDFEGDKHYDKPISGSFSNDKKYSVIHRVMVDNRYRKKGYTKKLIKHAINISRENNIYNVRIDTHKDNKPMLALIDSLNFKFSAVVLMDDNSERKAYEYFIEEA